MFKRHYRIILALTTFVVLGLANSTAHADTVYLYDPELGTLPESQGFTRIEQGSPPQPTVNGGILHQFLAPGDNVQWWQRDSVSLNFATTRYVLEATLRVISSNYIPNIGTGQRSGYYLWAVDAAGRNFAVGIASTGVTINTDAPFQTGQGVPFTPFNTTDNYHNYRLVIEDGMGSLFIDGNLFAATPLGGAVRPDVPNRVLFGDASGLGVSETDLGLFRFDIVNYRLPFTGLYLITNGPTCGHGAKQHKGFTMEAIDYGLPIDKNTGQGTPVLATEAGEVIFAGSDPFAFPPHDLTGFGTYMVIEHADGSRSYYAHLSQTLVTSGDVTKGQLIAYSGDTGKASGHPHLHFQIQDRNDNPIPIRELSGTTWYSLDPNNPCNKKQGKPDGEAIGPSVP